MGTHPIFESDFDCLTEMGDMDKKLDEIKLAVNDKFAAQNDRLAAMEAQIKYIINLLEHKASPSVNSLSILTESGEIGMVERLENLRTNNQDEIDEVKTLQEWAANASGQSEELIESFTEPEIRDGAQSRETLCSFAVLPSDITQQEACNQEVISVSESTDSFEEITSLVCQSENNEDVAVLESEASVVNIENGQSVERPVRKLSASISDEDREKISTAVAAQAKRSMILLTQSSS